MPVPSVKFYIESLPKGTDIKKALPIFMYLRYNGKTIKVFANRKCPHNAWKDGKANYRKSSNAVEVNGFLAHLKEEAENLCNHNSRAGVETTIEHLRELVQTVSGVGKKKIQLIQFAEEWTSNAGIKDVSKQAYMLTIEYLKKFSTYKNKSFGFNDIDLNFHADFIEWLSGKHSLNDNTVGKHIKNIKALMNQAFERDLHTNLSYKKKGFRVFKRPGDSIYLNEAELQRLLVLNLSEDNRLEKVRDVFIIGCWTGLRFSDLVRLTKDKFITEDGILLLRIETEKTGEVVKIPISPRILPLLEKYEFNIPMFSNPTMNAYLKELGRIKEAGLGDEVEISDVRGGKKSWELYKKHQLITTHTARRSFASNLYLQGVPSRSIMAITGHRTEKSFMEYIKLSHMEKIRAVDTHFKKVHDPKLKVA
jgi:integrase